MKKLNLKMPNLRYSKVMRGFFVKPKIKETILNQTRKDKNIIYGAQSIKKQLGILGRETQDYDIFAKKPKTSALKTDRRLDKIWGSNHFYVKKAEHKGTWKVMNKGLDGKKGTRDDVGIVDYTKMSRPTPRYVVIEGARYRILSQEKKAKYKSLRDKKMKFRSEKDREDVERIKFATETIK